MHMQAPAPGEPAELGGRRRGRRPMWFLIFSRPLALALQVPALNLKGRSEVVWATRRVLQASGLAGSLTLSLGEPQRVPRTPPGKRALELPLAAPLTCFPSSCPRAGPDFWFCCGPAVCPVAGHCPLGPARSTSTPLCCLPLQAGSGGSSAELRAGKALS